MNCTILQSTWEHPQECTSQHVFSMYHSMQQIPDRRRRQGTRYPLALILTSIVLAKLAGETTLQAISEWIRLRGEWVQQMLPQSRSSFPCIATYSNVLRSVDPAEVNAVLISLLTRLNAPHRELRDQQHVALDGKTLRGTQKHEAPIHRRCIR